VSGRVCFAAPMFLRAGLGREADKGVPNIARPNCHLTRDCDSNRFRSIAVLLSTSVSVLLVGCSANPVTKTVVVHANAVWIQTGLTNLSGLEVEIIAKEVDGVWTITPNGWLGPNGMSGSQAPGSYNLPGVEEGCLVAKWSGGGGAFKVGEHYKGIGGSGELLLGINDDAMHGVGPERLGHSDNQGTVIVTIAYTPRNGWLIMIRSPTGLFSVLALVVSILSLFVAYQVGRGHIRPPLR